MTYYLCLVKIDTVQQGKLTREKLGMQEGGQLNPYIIEHLEQQKTNGKMIQYASQFKIEGIFQENRPFKDELFNPVRVWCYENHMPFEIRLFDSEVFWEDREMIERLPAFNIYFRDEYESTFYPEESVEKNVLKIIDSLSTKRLLKKKTLNKPAFSFSRFLFIKFGKKKLLTSS
jgi:hypothetical protein